MSSSVCLFSYHIKDITVPGKSSISYLFSFIGYLQS